MPSKVLILFAHPALQKSRVNCKLIQGINEIEGVTFRDLYQIYPEFYIDSKEEQDLLEAHDVIIFHHPFFWYSTPALLKEWQDIVLEHDWAYGKNGNALKGKIFFNVLTSGGKEEAYQKDGYNRFTIRQLIAPLEQTARLCKMEFLPPFVVHGSYSITNEEIQKQKNDYHLLLKAFVENRVDIHSAKSLTRMNENVNLVIKNFKD